MIVMTSYFSDLFLDNKQYFYKIKKKNGVQVFNYITSTISPHDVIDIHVHLGGPAEENNANYFWSHYFEKSVTHDGIKLVTRISGRHLSGLRYLSVLYHQIKTSRYVDKVVLLALDMVYSLRGKAVPKDTHIYTSNQYVAHLALMYPEFLFGCSVHPYDPLALERLWHCVNHGAVLCKWIPSSQAIDPTHPLSQRFYKALAVLDLPLLLHVGPEEAVPSAIDEKKTLLYNSAAGEYGREPGDAISMALGEGVRVIVAHCAVPLGSLLDKNHLYWESVFDKLLKRVTADIAKITLYADTSAFCLPGRFKYVERIIPFAMDMPHRFLLGSDYPLPIVSFRQTDGLQEVLDAFGWLASRVLPVNDFDKNYQLLHSHFPDKIFTSASAVLRDPQLPVPSLEQFQKKTGLKKRHFIFF